jgi:hypothetical protein
MIDLVLSMAILRFALSWVFRRRWRVVFCGLWTLGFVVVSDMLVYLMVVDGEKEFIVVGRWVVEREVMSRVV